MVPCSLAPLRRVIFACVLGSTALTSSALAQTPPDHGFTWATITHPGNRDANQTEAPRVFPPWSTPALPIGGVDHEYRIATTEVSVSQWFEFVQAYQPYYTGSPNDAAFTSIWISFSGGSYHMQPGSGNRPAGMSWRNAARFVNWLHNDKRVDRDAFENGVYDTSTFFTNPDGTFTDQREHSFGARFWLPTLDELTKAVYYDPNRYGEGMEGYWLYPNGTNTPLIPGYPEEGGQTAAGLDPGAPGARWLDIGSYPDVRTPWGLLDASGGIAEWTEGINLDGTDRAFRSTSQFGGAPDTFDRIDHIRALPPQTGTFVGIRLASSVPSPGAFPGLVLCFWMLHSRRRQS